MQRHLGSSCGAYAFTDKDESVLQKTAEALHGDALHVEVEPAPAAELFTTASTTKSTDLVGVVENGLKVEARGVDRGDGPAACRVVDLDALSGPFVPGAGGVAFMLLHRVRWDLGGYRRAESDLIVPFSLWKVLGRPQHVCHPPSMTSPWDPRDHHLPSSPMSAAAPWTPFRTWSGPIQSGTL
jgi:hypothetical protein